MSEFLKALSDVIGTQYIWISLGIVSGMAMFISPILYKGDYKMATKTVVVVMGYAFFVALISFFYLKNANMGIQLWFERIIILSLVGIAYILGLFLGVHINKRTIKKASQSK